jgi:hypothetical protein
MTPDTREKAGLVEFGNDVPSRGTAKEREVVSVGSSDLLMVVFDLSLVLVPVSHLFRCNLRSSSV